MHLKCSFNSLCMSNVFCILEISKHFLAGPLMHRIWAYFLIALIMGALLNFRENANLKCFANNQCGQEERCGIATLSQN